jgi:hypothetical protein
VLHWPEGANGRGVLLTGDIIQVVADRRLVSFMYSYPNLIPLSAETVRDVTASVSRLSFDRIYGARWDAIVAAEARAAVARSAALHRRSTRSR